MTSPCSNRMILHRWYALTSTSDRTIFWRSLLSNAKRSRSPLPIGVRNRCRQYIRTEWATENPQDWADLVVALSTECFDMRGLIPSDGPALYRGKPYLWGRRPLYGRGLLRAHGEWKKYFLRRVDENTLSLVSANNKPVRIPRAPLDRSGCVWSNQLNTMLQVERDPENETAMAA